MAIRTNRGYYAAMLTPVALPAEVPVRLPPHNFEAEQALLGAIFSNNRALERVVEFLTAEHFAEPLHGRIYDACRILIDRGQIANPVTLKTFLGGDTDLARLGGDSYLTRLVGAAASIINAHDYGRLVYDLHLRRALIALGEDVVNDAFQPEPGQSASEQIVVAESRLFDLAASGRLDGGLSPFKSSLTAAIEMAEAAYKRDGRLSGVTTGLLRLDAVLGGLHRSDLVVLAGRPGMGKSALATNIAVSAARAHRVERGEDGVTRTQEGALVALFSLEMSSDQLATRVLGEVARIPSNEVREGRFRNEEFLRLADAARELERLPLYLDDTPALTLSAIRTRARRLHRTRSAQGGLGLIVIDYLQLIAPPGGSRRAENRVQELSEITRGLKALAKEINVPVLALSQLSRAVEQREDKRPQLSDLRESGSIEQDADVVMFIFREEYYLDKQGPPARRDNESEEHYDQRCVRYRDDMAKAHNKAEVIIAKQRHGPTGKIDLFFDGRFTKFDNLDEQHGAPPPFE